MVKLPNYFLTLRLIVQMLKGEYDPPQNSFVMDILIFLKRCAILKRSTSYAHAVQSLSPVTTIIF